MSTLPNRERVPEYHYASEQSKALIDMLEDASLEAKAALEDVMARFRKPQPPGAHPLGATGGLKPTTHCRWRPAARPSGRSSWPAAIPPQR